MQGRDVAELNIQRSDVVGREDAFEQALRAQSGILDVSPLTEAPPRWNWWRGSSSTRA